MAQIKKISIVLMLLLIVMGAASCGLFKGKNKCGDCPNWSQNEPQKDNSDVKHV